MTQPDFEPHFSSWRQVARDYISRGVPPVDLDWGRGSKSLFDLEPSLNNAKSALSRLPAVPPRFIKLAKTVSLARDEDRWDLLYRLLFRLIYENKNLLHINVDPDVHRAQLLEKSISKDIHKMHAFVRFKEVTSENGETYVAWHQPEHRILRPASKFFVRRFGDKPWSIFTPDASAHWDTKELRWGKGLPQCEFQAKDQWDDVWVTYYKSIFNPARIKIKMMKSEMAPKYWSSLPETEVIYDLLREAPQQLQNMATQKRQAAGVQPAWNLETLKEKSKICQACPLHKPATQVVFGEGHPQASLMIVGEQPGDQEDQLGRPFSGPTGVLLDSLLTDIGLNRKDIYLTNAVKHFKFEKKGQRRIHKTANGSEMHACRPWLMAEIANVRPRVILLLGKTASVSVRGKLDNLNAIRGQVLADSPFAAYLLSSWHPSAILRERNDEKKSLRLDELKKDLKQALSLSLQNPQRQTT